jgi:hypothetical protein
MVCGHLKEIDTPQPEYNSDKEVITSSWVKDTDKMSIGESGSNEKKLLKRLQHK